MSLGYNSCVPEYQQVEALETLERSNGEARRSQHIRDLCDGLDQERHEEYEERIISLLEKNNELLVRNNELMEKFLVKVTEEEIDEVIRGLEQEVGDEK